MTVCEVVAADIFVATVFIKVVAVAVSAILANIASASRSTHTHYNKENIVTSQHKEKKLTDHYGTYQTLDRQYKIKKQRDGDIFPANFFSSYYGTTTSNQLVGVG